MSKARPFGSRPQQPSAVPVATAALGGESVGCGPAARPPRCSDPAAEMSCTAVETALTVSLGVWRALVNVGMTVDQPMHELLIAKHRGPSAMQIWRLTTCCELSVMGLDATA